MSGKAEPIVSEDEGVHEKRGYAGVFAGLAAGGPARKTLCQFMLRISRLLVRCGGAPVVVGWWSEVRSVPLCQRLVVGSRREGQPYGRRGYARVEPAGAGLAGSALRPEGLRKKVVPD